MRFVVSARRFDANGLLFSRDITSLSTPEEIAHALEGDFAEVQGGYVLLFDRRIWNSPQHALFDAEHVLCEMDSIAYAALMLEDCATHFEDPDMQSVAFAEMISLRVEEIGVGAREIGHACILSEGPKKRRGFSRKISSIWSCVTPSSRRRGTMLFEMCR